MPTVNPSLHQETPFNKDVTSLKDKAPDKVNNLETAFFHLLQWSDHVCNFEFEDANDFYKFPNVDNDDDWHWFW